jgi:hypothetical protein
MNVCSCHSGRPDINMGDYCNSKKCSFNKPIENIFFKEPKIGGTYKIMVNYYSGPKCNSSSESPFKLQIDSGGEAITYEGVVSTNNK